LIKPAFPIGKIKKASATVVADAFFIAQGTNYLL
jgi:hypothetical protein